MKVLGKEVLNLMQKIPLKLEDLNKLGIKRCDLDRSIDVPQYQDLLYVKRREQIGHFAAFHKLGQRIKNVQYIEDDHNTWRQALKKLYHQHPKVMCQSYLQNMGQIQRTLNFSKSIPDINDLSDYLQEKSGFLIKPVAGFISSRQFLNSLAFKVFCSAQFIRHPQSLDFTVQPDLIHDYVGHIPQLANPQIAKITQKIGELSLGASEQSIKKLSLAFIYTIQYGLCKQDGAIKAIGGAFGGCLADMIRLEKGNYNCKLFQPIVNCPSEQIDYQKPFENFYLSETLQTALQKLTQFGETLTRPFSLQYNAKKREFSVLQPKQK